MIHPNYQFRINKSVDRLLFIELLKRIDSLTNIKFCDYNYYSLGGPFMEDFRLMYQNFPDMNFVCIENDAETQKRQKFHRPCKNISFYNGLISDYLTSYEPTGKDIFWLDFTSFKISDLKTFQEVLSKIEKNGIIKITLNVESPFKKISDDKKRTLAIDEFKEQFREYLPISVNASSFRQANFYELAQEMLRIAAQGILISSNLTFQILSSFWYADGAAILTLTGVVVETKDRKKIINSIKGWKHENTNWDSPHKINVPGLTLKERLTVEQLLPTKTMSVKALVKRLGYEIGNGLEDSEEQLKQYAEFYRFYPLFSKITL